MSEFYLKILSGNHIGAEIPLEPGQYTLGKADGCDLILTDDSLDDIDLIIDIANDGSITVSTKNQPNLYLNGAPEGQALTPDHFDVVTSNGIHFALGPVDAAWPDIEIPNLQKPESQKTETGESGEAGDENDFPDPDASEDDNNESVEAESPEAMTESLDEEEEGEAIDIDKKWLIGIPVVFITLMTIFAVLLFTDPEETQPEIKISNIDQAKIIKSKLQLQDIKFRQLPDGTILVSGYTQTLDKKENLINQFREKKLPFRSQVIVMNDMRANAEALLKNRGYKSLNIELDNTPGSLILTGYVVSSDQLEKVINMLKEEVYGLNSVVDQVENQSGRVKSLKAMIKEKGLASRVHLIERPGKILVQGLLLDEGQIYKLQEVANRFKTRYNNQPAVIIATQYSQANQFALPSDLEGTDSSGIAGTANMPALIVANKRKIALRSTLTVRGVSMGPIPYVIMEDGGKYLIGAKLDNGYIIEDINLDYLLLSDGSQRIKYQLGGKSSDKKE